MAKKILLIDDHPDDEFETGRGEDGHQELQEILGELFSDKYEVLIEEDPSNVNRLVEADQEIEVVLLDIEFDGDPKGAEIAKAIEEINSEIRIVVLTRIKNTGTKITFGHRKNVWYYFVKKNLRELSGREELKGVVTALIEDPYNTKWYMDYDSKKYLVTLDHPDLTESIQIAIRSGEQQNGLPYFLKFPNKCRDVHGVDGNFNPASVVSNFNERVSRKTGYMTWGFFHSKSCEPNFLRIMVGQKLPDAKRLSLENTIIHLEETMAALKKDVASHVRSLKGEIKVLEEKIAELEVQQ